MFLARCRYLTVTDADFLQQERWSSTPWSLTLKTGSALSRSLTSSGTTKWSQTASSRRTRSSSSTPTSPKTRPSDGFTTVSRAKARVKENLSSVRLHVFYSFGSLTLTSVWFTVHPYIPSHLIPISVQWVHFKISTELVIKGPVCRPHASPC